MIAVTSLVTLAGAQTSLVNPLPETRQSSISSDGRYVAFTQWDGVNPAQVYLKDLQTLAVTLVSQDGFGNPGAGSSTNPKVTTTANGNVYVTFSSLADLTGTDTNGVRDVYLATVSSLASSLEVVSATSGGVLGNATSDSGEPNVSNGRVLVAFRSDATNLGAPAGGSQVYYRDMTIHQSSSPVLVSRATSGGGGNGDSGYSQVSISGNGTVIAFASSATNLIAKDTNAAGDIFTYNVASAAINLVTKTSTGKQLSGSSWTPKLNGDGNKVAFVTQVPIATNDTGSYADVYVANVTNPASVTMTLASVNNAKKPTSGNWNSGWIDPAGTTHPLIQGDPGWSLCLSANGRYVAFHSIATNLVSGDSNGKMDVFVRDLVGNTTVMASVDPSGGPSNNDSYCPTLSADGSKVAFVSFATNLVSPSTAPGYFNAFVR